MKSSAIAVLLLAALWCGDAFAQSPVRADQAAMLADVAGVMADEGIPGAQVAVLPHDGTVWEHAFGVRDLASSAPMAPDTLVQVGSTTKIFTASLVADLVAEGKLYWSDTLAECLPGVPMRADFRGITLEALATHSARLPPNPPNRVDIDGVMQPYGVEQLYASLLDPSVKLGEPGRTYSNWGYALLGHVVEKAAGARFEDVLKQRIFVPLGMRDSTIALTAADERRLATHYWPEDTPRVPRPRWVFGEVAGFGGITGTANDLARFLAYQIAPQAQPDVLDAEAIESLRPVRTLGASWQAGGGRGWLVVRDTDGTVILEHSGEVDGHSSYIGFCPDHKVGVAVTANLGGSSARRIGLPLLARAVAQARRSEPADKPLAQAYARNRQWADAQTALAKVAAADPADGQTWFQLGQARYELRDLPGAETALIQAAKTSADPASAWFLLAAIAASQGRADEAFSRLDRIDPGAFKRTCGTPGSVPFNLDRRELHVLHTDSRWWKYARR